MANPFGSTWPLRVAAPAATSLARFVLTVGAGNAVTVPVLTSRVPARSLTLNRTV